jgi:hypothetical protein
MHHAEGFPNQEKPAGSREEHFSCKHINLSLRTLTKGVGTLTIDYVPLNELKDFVANVDDDISTFIGIVAVEERNNVVFFMIPLDVR